MSESEPVFLEKDIIQPFEIHKYISFETSLSDGGLKHERNGQIFKCHETK